MLYTTTLPRIPAYTDETTTADEIFCDRFGDREHDNSQAFGASVHSEDDDDNERPKRTSIDCKYRATPTPSAIAASMVVEANDINDTSDRDTSRASLGFAVAQSSQRAPGRTVGIELGRRALALRAPPPSDSLTRSTRFRRERQTGTRTSYQKNTSHVPSAASAAPAPGWCGRTERNSRR